jgi:hypothetical protein
MASKWDSPNGRGTMTVTLEQLQEFIAEQPPETTPAAAAPLLGDDAGSYTLEKLGEVLQLWADANSEFQFSAGRTSRGQGFNIRCPGDMDDGWPDGARHTDRSSKLTSSAVVWVENGHPRFRCGHSHCDQGAVTLKKTWKHLVQALDPGGWMQRRVLTGYPTLGSIMLDPITVTVNDATPPEDGYDVVDHTEEGHTEEGPAPKSATVSDTAQEPAEEAPSSDTPRAGEIKYPTEVWDGTDYAEFARRGTKGNFIPPEFFIESLKTYVGAIAGNTMRITNERSGKPRFYTILLAGPGTGKNTAIDCTSELFRGHDSSLIAGASPKEALIWYPQHKIENSMYSRIGACKMKMSSASGLARSLPRVKDGKVCNSPQERVIVVYTELSELFEKLGIEGSGAAMMSALCDLYDGEDFIVPALADNDSFGGRLMMSILAGVQPRKWDMVCAGKGIEGSGFDERINLIPTSNTKTVASLEEPNFEGFQMPFLDKLMALDKEPYLVLATAEAKALANEEYQKLKPTDEEGPSAGRLNVLAWRNALHYSWLVGAPVVSPDAVARGMKLARYQLEVRKAYKPLTGDNHVARAANAIQRVMEKYGVGVDVKLRDLERATNANRMGGTFDSALVLLANRGRIIQHEQKLETKGGPQTVRFVRRLE